MINLPHIRTNAHPHTYAYKSDMRFNIRDLYEEKMFVNNRIELAIKK